VVYILAYFHVVVSFGSSSFHNFIYGIFVAFLRFPFSTIKAFAIRLVVGDIVISIFIVTRAGASVFYPGTPNSWTEFVISFLNGLMHGPC